LKEIIINKYKLNYFTNYFKRPKSSIFHRGLPAELLNELFAALPLENAFTLLTKMPNVLLARNIQKMTNTKKVGNLQKNIIYFIKNPYFIVNDSEQIKFIKLWAKINSS
jgi:hypothetical protein